MERWACYFLIAPISYFASRLSSTAGFYTWVAHGLGADLGFLTGWLVFGAYAIFEAASQAAFGGLMDFNLSTFFGITIPGGYGWVIYAAASVLLVGVLGYFGVQLTVRIMAIFSSLEIVGLLVFNVAVTIHGGKSGQDFLHTFTPAGADASVIHGIVPGGIIGMGIALTLVVFSNIGFESASGYGEESKSPHRFIPLAMFSVLVVTAVLYIWTAYSQVIGVGATNAGSVLGNLAQAPGPFYGLANTHVGYWFEVAIGILLTTSTWASCLAFHNVAARYLYGMAREDQIPFFSRPLSKTQAENREPVGREHSPNGDFPGLRCLPGFRRSEDVERRLRLLRSRNRRRRIHAHRWDWHVWLARHDRDHDPHRGVRGDRHCRALLCTQAAAGVWGP